MLESLGPLYYAVVFLELAMWGGLLFLGWAKLSKSRQTESSVPAALG
jgi:hypothetical protein